MSPSKPLKIAVWHNLGSGGAKRSLYEHVKGLQARGHIVEAWCPSSADATYLPLGDMIPEHVLPFEWQEPDETGFINRHTWCYTTVTTKLAAMARHCAQCADEIAARDFDVLYSNSCMFLRAPPIARFLDHLPRVLFLQEPYRWLYEALPKLPWPALPDDGRQPWHLRSVKRFIQNLILVQGMRVQAREELTSARAFNEILVNSYFSRESVLRAYGLDATVCYLGISTETFSANAAPRERYVFGLGSLIYEKGVDTALRAVAAIPADRRPSLVWAGNLASARYLEDMKSLAQSLGVHFVPKVLVADTELCDLATRAGVMLYTSRLEPFGFAPLEANACGTPVVAIAEGGVRETVHDGRNGLLVGSRDPAQIAAAILRVLDNADLARALGDCGRAMVRERWTWDAAVTRLEQRLVHVVAQADHARAGTYALGASVRNIAPKARELEQPLDGAHAIP